MCGAGQNPSETMYCRAYVAHVRTAGITVKLPPLARLDHGKHVKGFCQQNVLNFAKTSYLEFTFFSYNYIKSI